MNPSSNEQAGLNLPPPVVEQGAPLNRPTEAPKNQPEAAPGPVETQPQPGQSAPGSLPQTDLSMPTDSPAGAAQTAVSTTTHTNAPTMADDDDLIEKEWVNKAKKIVEATREDPNLQSKELSVFKADYMKKRYNKTIKLTE